MLYDTFLKEFGADPFRIGFRKGYKPKDPRLNIDKLAKSAPDLATDEGPVASEADMVYSVNTESFPSVKIITETDVHEQALPPVEEQSAVIDDIVGNDRAVSSTPAALARGLEVTPRTREALFHRDRWVQEPGCWVRIHERPRRALLTPFGTGNGLV